MTAERPERSSDISRRGLRALATVVASAAAIVAFSPASSLAAGPAPCGFALSAEAVLQRLNEIRTAGRVCHAASPAITGAATASGRPLKWNESLAAAALTQSQEMALQNRMSHRDRADRALGDRLKATGYRFSAAYENVAVGYGSVDDVVEAWLESEHHCENLMNAAVVELGLACMDGSAADPRGERRYWTMVLAAPPSR